MASEIARLRVALEMNSAAFETGMRRSAAQIDAFGSNAEKLGSKIGTLTRVLGGAAVAVAGSAIISSFAQVVQSGLDYAASLGEVSQQLGVTTKDLQIYRYAASQVGISQSEMDSSLAQLTKRIGQADAGNKGLAETFAKLGISLRDSNGHMITAGDAMPKIADAMAKIPDPAARAALQVELFGKSGQKLDTLLSGGSAEINNLAAAAQKLGLVMTPEMIARADQAADKLGAMKQVMQARIAGTVAENSDAIIALAEGLTKLVVAAGNAVTGIMKFKREYDAFIAGANAAVYGASPFASDQAKAKEYRAAQRAAQGLPPPKAARPTGGTGGHWSTARPGGLPRPSFLMPYQQQEQIQLSGGMQIWNPGGMEEFTRQIEAAGEETRRLHPEWSKVSDLIQKSGDKADTAAKRYKTSFLDATQSVLGALQNMEYAFSGGGGTVGKVSAVLGLITQLGGLGLFGKKVQGNVNNSMPAYAGGTDYHPGGFALVGERGPEIAWMPRSSKVWPNGSGPGGNVYNFSGNLMTEEFWARINAGHAQAAQAGAQMARRNTDWRNSRRLA